jgi:hypothetical protein
MGKNPQCITVDTLPTFAKATAGEAFVGPDVALAESGAVFSHLENRISTQPPLSRYGKVFPAFLKGRVCRAKQRTKKSGE